MSYKTIEEILVDFSRAIESHIPSITLSPKAYEQLAKDLGYRWDGKVTLYYGTTEILCSPQKN